MSGTDISTEQTMSGILAMLAAMREDALIDGTDLPRKSEVVLRDAGLSATQIAAILGKKPDTVMKTIQRARKPASTKKKVGNDGK